jgi:hypothetical protein
MVQADNCITGRETVPSCWTSMDIGHKFPEDGIEMLIAAMREN